MGTKNALSITLDQNNIEFIEKIAKKEKRSRSEIIDLILALFRKHKLKQDIEEGFRSRSKEDVKQAMSDFDDYLSLVDRKV